MKKKPYYIIMFVFLILLISCAREGDVCGGDDDCSNLKNHCWNKGNEGVLSLKPFCVDGACICSCGYRDPEGNYIQQFCD